MKKGDTRYRPFALLLHTLLYAAHSAFRLPINHLLKIQFSLFVYLEIPLVIQLMTKRACPKFFRHALYFNFSPATRLTWQVVISSILPEQDPERVLSFAKLLLILWRRGSYLLGITYLMKVFSLLSLTRNLENFTTKRITTALISCIVMWLCLSWHIPHTIRVWGLVIVYF